MKFGIFEAKRTVFNRLVSVCLLVFLIGCMKFGISGTKRTVRNGEVSVRGGLTV